MPSPVYSSGPLLMISERYEFSNTCFNEDSRYLMTEKIRGKAAFLHSNLSIEEFFYQLRGRKVLLLIHGYNTPSAGATKSFFNTAQKMSRAYDVVIGYTYPSQNGNGLGHVIAYPQAEKNITRLAHNRLSVHLQNLSLFADQVDVLAYSLGNQLFLKAMNASSRETTITNVFSIGAAADETQLQSCTSQECRGYGSALAKCNKVYVIFSCQDTTLEFFGLLRGTPAAGRPSRLIPHSLKEKVYQINATCAVEHHGDYLENRSVIELIELLASHTLIHGNHYALHRTGDLEPLTVKRARALLCSNKGSAIHQTARVVTDVITAPIRLVEDVVGSFF